MSQAAFSALLDTLNVPRGGIIYVQSSTDWLGKAGITAADVFAGLDAWIGTTGTLAMPTYPCRTTHLEYLRTHPTYDVRRTPAGIGLIPEVFRRRPHARRSLDPDFSIAAVGPSAAALTDWHLDEDPFGRSSSYERLIAAGATLLGLGVSLNTNSFIHVIDSRLQDRYAVRPYGDTFDTTVIDHGGNSTTVRRRALVPEFQQKTKPGEVATAAGTNPDLLMTTSVNGALFFRWNLARWSEWCQSHAEQAVAAGRLPCWLSRI